MKIKPLGSRIQISVDESKAGGLDVSGLNVAREMGKVVALGPEVTLPIKVGDRILFKAWAVDIINENGEKYHFIDQDSKGIHAIIK